MLRTCLALGCLVVVAVGCAAGSDNQDGENTEDALKRRGVSFRQGVCAVPAKKVTIAAHDSQGPLRSTVDVKAFSIDETEVTVEAYAACVAASKCPPAGTVGDCTAGKPGLEKHPITCVDHAQATAYCASLGKRLPTDAEWELAARGSDGRTYPWGKTSSGGEACTRQPDAPADPDAGDDVGGPTGGGAGSCEVKTHAKDSSPYGVRDMGGNAQEWTATKDRQTDEYVARGGSFGAPMVPIDGTDRAYRASDDQGINLGFRCVR